MSSFSPDKMDFSFLYGNKHFSELKKSVIESKFSNNSYSIVYTLEDGLKITQEITRYAGYSAVGWVLWFENSGTEDTDLISELFDCDNTYDISAYNNFVNWTPGYMLKKTNPPKVWSTVGSNCVKDEYCSYPEELPPNTQRKYSCTGGRSSQGLAPYFDLNDGKTGLLVAIGWTGQWNAAFLSDEKSIRVTTGIENLSFRLHAGEKIRTSSVLLVSYENGQNEGHIAFRRLIKNKLSLIGKTGRPDHGPLSVMAWGGVNSRTMIKRIEKLQQYEMGIEAFWIDAGWYGYSKDECASEFTGDWPVHTGSWCVNQNYHPDRLEYVSKAIKKAGMQFILWVEPERVLRHTDMPEAHTDWFLELEKENPTLLLNLGNEEALLGTFEMLEEKIRTLGIDCYRQDFNIDPLEYWRNNDEKDRRGITQITHIMGLYRLWDMLLERFPNIYIDNCASGGRRNDIEMMSRSLPLWRSDYQCAWDAEPETAQNHTTGISWWLPYSGTGMGRIMGDQYRTRSCYAPATVCSFWTYGDQEDPNDSQPLNDIRAQFAEYKRVRPFTSCDFYQLTEPNISETVWCAWQYNRPEENDGIILAFRRSYSPYSTAAFKLDGLNPKASYRFKDADTGEVTVLTGAKAMERFDVLMDKPRSSKLIFYKKLDK